MRNLVAIVEGHGEVQAVPILIRRIAEAVSPGVVPEVSRPMRVKRSGLLKEGELERAIDLAARTVGADGRILVLLDADRDCPAELGPRILLRANAARNDRLIRVVLAKVEYEAWFLAAADSIAGLRGLREDATAPVDPESIRDAKGWLRPHARRPILPRDAGSSRADRHDGPGRRAPRSSFVRQALAGRDRVARVTRGDWRTPSRIGRVIDCSRPLVENPRSSNRADFGAALDDLTVPAEAW